MKTLQGQVICGNCRHLHIEGYRHIKMPNGWCEVVNTEVA